MHAWHCSSHNTLSWAELHANLHANPLMLCSTCVNTPIYSNLSHPLLARCLILQGALHACMCPADVSTGPFLFFLQFLSWFHTNTCLCTCCVYTCVFDMTHMQIQTLFLWCCLHAVWTHPFIHTGSMHFLCVASCMLCELSLSPAHAECICVATLRQHGPFCEMLKIFLLQRQQCPVLSVARALLSNWTQDDSIVFNGDIHTKKNAKMQPSSGMLCVKTLDIIFRWVCICLKIPLHEMCRKVNEN